MTLRARLTAAFLAVVLGPVLIGAFFVGATVAAVSHNRSLERLDLAASSARTSVNALCQQLQAAADAVAMIVDPARVSTAATQVVTRGLATAVRITRPNGAEVFATPNQPPQPWADCAEGEEVAGPQAISARVEMRDVKGRVLGYVTVSRHVDTAFITRLAAATGAAVTLLPGEESTPRTTEADWAVGPVVETAKLLDGDGTAESDVGRYVRRVAATPGQPLPLVLSVPRQVPQELYAVLVGTVLIAGLGAVVAAWWLARSTTRPLAELAHAADRVADGDLSARVPVRGNDEVGRLASTFNRMTRETQTYVQALTVSRDQLRGHLAILGDTLSSTHDLDRILRVILQTALAATGARAGAVLVYDPEQGVLTGHYAEGFDGSLPTPSTLGDGDDPPAESSPRTHSAPAASAGASTPASPPPAVRLALPSARRAPEGQSALATGDTTAQLTIPLGVGLLGSVAVSGEPRRGRVERDGPKLAAEEPSCTTYVAVPFSVTTPVVDPAAAPDSTARPTTPSSFGVLALYDRLGSDEFDDSDLVTLRTFAAQAAVAVDNVRVHREAQRLSRTDPLTGLWNYRQLQETLHSEIERANRFHRRLALLALDLDRFKDINDTYGHLAGDAVLKEFARRVRGEIREIDGAFRNGGEEFVVLLPETDASGAAVVAERLGAVVRDTPITVDVSGETIAIPVTVSIGIAVYPEHGASGQQVLDAADDALYEAKAGGRDTYRIARSSRATDPDRTAVPTAVASREGDVPPSDGASFGSHPPRQTSGR